MPFLKGIYHSYSSDNEMIIKMNDTYDRYFFYISKDKSQTINKYSPY